jgi:hypothetical protein
MKRADDGRGMKARGWASLAASVLMIALISCVWFFLARAIAEHRITNYDAATASSFGQIFAGFALVVVSGLLGIASSVVQIRSGRRSRILTVGVVVAFVAAFVTLMIAVGTHRS